MANTKQEAQKIELDKFKLILDEGVEGTLVRGGIRIEFNANGGVDVYSNGVEVYSAANNNTKPPRTTLQIGETMPDGMKNAGISPTTGKPFYVDAVDAPGFYTFGEAKQYAADQGKRVPTKAELNVLFNNKAAIGGFNVNVTGSDPAGWYWSSSRTNFNFFAWAQRFSDGYPFYNFRYSGSSLRLVRD